jgi:hypothetical protein
MRRIVVAVVRRHCRAPAACQFSSQASPGGSSCLSIDCAVEVTTLAAPCSDGSAAIGLLRSIFVSKADVAQRSQRKIRIDTYISTLVPSSTTLAGGIRK